MWTLKSAATLAIISLFGFQTPAPADEPKDGSPPKEAQKKTVDESAIRALIAQLGDEAFENRDAAHKRLAEIGGPALELLKKTAKDSADAETRERATRLIQEIQESGLHVVRAQFHHDFRKSGYPLDKFRPNGPNAEKWIKAEPEGLRIAIPADKAASAAAAGVAPNFKIKGDFEVTVAYEILSAGPPQDGYGTGLEVYLMTDTEKKEAVAFDRRTLPGGGEVYACSRNTTNAQGQRQFLGQGDVPAKGKAGRIRIIRIGPKVVLAVEDEMQKGFRVTHRVDLGTEDLALLRFAANAGRGAIDVDVRVHELAIRCAQADALRPIAGADKASRKSEK
jgi:hypothetical protein